MTERDAARHKSLEDFQQRIGWRFAAPELLDEALTHSSYAHEHGLLQWNERLEFLGDAVLEVLISEELFRKHSAAGEGQLTRERSSLVREEVLTAWGRSLGVDSLLRAGKGQRRSVTENMTGDAVEAIIGALYIDGGLEAARAFLKTRPVLAESELLDAKSRLQILCQERGGTPPRYELLSRSGPGHDPFFTARVLLGGEELASGSGTSRKSAEQDAARNALRLLDQESMRA